MKKKKLILVTSIFLLSSISFQSCIGSFSLTNKVLTWNHNVNNKFINELVFFAFWVLPVYEVTAVADLLVINSIEFWSGSNPLEANNKVIETEHGNYQILADTTGYKIVNPDGNVICFEFDATTQTWSFSKEGAEKTDFLKFTDAEHVKILGTNGEFVDVELNEEGVNEYKRNLNLAYMATL